MISSRLTCSSLAVVIAQDLKALETLAAFAPRQFTPEGSDTDESDSEGTERMTDDECT